MTLWHCVGLSWDHEFLMAFVIKRHPSILLPRWHCLRSFRKWHLMTTVVGTHVCHDRCRVMIRTVSCRTDAHPFKLSVTLFMFTLVFNWHLFMNSEMFTVQSKTVIFIRSCRSSSEPESVRHREQPGDCALGRSVIRLHHGRNERVQGLCVLEKCMLDTWIERNAALITLDYNISKWCSEEIP